MNLFRRFPSSGRGQVRRGERSGLGQRLLSLVLVGVLTPSVVAQGSSVGTPYCFGDGTGTPCPCGNNGLPGNGCASSVNPNGANLSASGNAYISFDSLVLSGSGMPNSSALYFQGTTQANGGLGSLFGDGLRCAGGSITRLGTKTNVAGASQYPASGDPAISVRGLVTSPGTRTYQVWYRNAAVFCVSSTFNLTNGLSVTWALWTPPGMVAIPAGTFDMGSNAASGLPYFGSASEQPVHQVTISYSFWMGQHEVTQSEYAALMGTNPSYFLGANNPVEQVNWFNAQAYCAALTAQQSALGNVPPGYQYRLPTEAEWEYACRAGTTTEFNVGSALFCNQARIYYSYHSNSLCSTTSTEAVEIYAPNAWGLYDMHGNVFEWCLDSNAAYSAGAVTDPFVTGGASRVFRGGCWRYGSNVCRSARRGSYDPGSTTNDFGFRVVLAPVLVP
jgi:formylglycine-generating enzyme required for sulfatase activity